MTDVPSTTLVAVIAEMKRAWAAVAEVEGLTPGSARYLFRRIDFMAGAFVVLVTIDPTIDTSMLDCVATTCPTADLFPFPDADIAPPQTTH